MAASHDILLQEEDVRLMTVFVTKLSTNFHGYNTYWIEVLHPSQHLTRAGRIIVSESKSDFSDQRIKKN